MNTVSNGSASIHANMRGAVSSRIRRKALRFESVDLFGEDHCPKAGAETRRCGPRRSIPPREGRTPEPPPTPALAASRSPHPAPPRPSASRAGAARQQRRWRRRPSTPKAALRSVHRTAERPAGAVDQGGRQRRQGSQRKGGKPAQGFECGNHRVRRTLARIPARGLRPRPANLALHAEQLQQFPLQIEARAAAVPFATRAMWPD